MVQVVANSPSLILRASHILVGTIESVVERPWAARKPSGEERSVPLTLKLDEVIKGTATQKPGESITIDVSQVRYFVPWSPPPGAWSSVSLQPRSRVVVFARTGSHDAAVVLDDPSALRIMPPEEGLTDVHLAQVGEEGALTLAEFLARAKPMAPELGELFADYLWARYGAEAMADPGEFELVARLLEEPGLNQMARTTLVMTLPTSVLAQEPPASRQLNRLALAFFHLLAMPEARKLHDNIVGTYLPNLLDLPGGTPRPSSSVFHDSPGERTRAEKALAAYKGSESVEPLVMWIRQTTP